MKKSFTLFLSLFIIFSLSAQNIPVDFETGGNGGDWTWTVFENDTNPALEIVANPNISGINTSETVAKFTALQTGNPWAGCESLHGTDIGSFTINASNSTIRIMVWKSVISDVGIKLVTASGWSKGELKVANTKVNEWEQLTFDFSTVDHEGMTYDQIVVFPDFNARTADQIIYFDNVYGDVAVASSVTTIEEQNISLSPNPAQDEITFLSEKEASSIQIFSVAGQLVWEDKNVGQSSTINTTDFAKGMYIFKAQIGDDTLVDKFVKK